MVSSSSADYDEARPVVAMAVLTTKKLFRPTTVTYLLEKVAFNARKKFAFNERRKLVHNFRRKACWKTVN
jgi:hypothetical protein